MSEQSGRNGSSERPGSGSERPGPEGPGSERASSQPSGAQPSGSTRSGSGGSGSGRSGSGRSGSARSGSARQRQSTPASDMLSDLQRWLVRSSARSMGRELSGQVRRTLGGGRQQPSASNVWDTATTEIPPDVGESPECQWCPICRAARRMREGGSGIGGQLSGAGDAVATVVQDAIGALDSILSRASSGDQHAASSSRTSASGKSGSAPARRRSRLPLPARRRSRVPLPARRRSRVPLRARRRALARTASRMPSEPAAHGRMAPTGLRVAARRTMLPPPAIVTRKTRRPRSPEITGQVAGSPATGWRPSAS